MQKLILCTQTKLILLGIFIRISVLENRFYTEYCLALRCSWYQVLLGSQFRERACMIPDSPFPRPFFLRMLVFAYEPQPHVNHQPHKQGR